jgi:hypothetical protein
MSELPEGKEFAFTIIDDTDNSKLEDIIPIYNLLKKLSLYTTKTVWIYPSRDNFFYGDTIQNPQYLAYMKELANAGFEIALHNVGSGVFTRPEILKGIEEFEEKIGYPPKLLTCHGWNPDNLYWGSKRFRWPINIINAIRDRGRYWGEVDNSPYFWGDIIQEKIMYVRNYTFYNINLNKVDLWFPYRDRKKPYVNYWFSAVDARSIKEFLYLLKPANIDKLIQEKGICILYTHFANGFVNNGKVHPEVKQRLTYISKHNGYFVPASTLLDYLRIQRRANNPYLPWWKFWILDMRWFFDHVRILIKNKFCH